LILPMSDPLLERLHSLTANLLQFPFACADRRCSERFRDSSLASSRSRGVSPESCQPNILDYALAVFGVFK